MAYIPQPNTGTLYLDGKERPSKNGGTYIAYSGFIDVEGKQYWLNGFKKKIKTKDNNEVEIMDLKLKPKESSPVERAASNLPF